MLDQRQREPFAHHRQVSAPEQLQRRLGHRVDVLPDQHGIVVRTGPVRAGDQDQQRRHDA
jgi:hypothetical protein